MLVSTNGINGTLICVNGTSVPLTAANSEVINQTQDGSKWKRMCVYAQLEKMSQDSARPGHLSLRET